MAEQKASGENGAKLAKALRFALVEERDEITTEERSAQAVQRIIEAMRAARKKAERQARVA